MRRNLSLALAILVLSACVESPTGSNGPWVSPDDVLTLQVGPDVSDILVATPGTDVSGFVTEAWTQQQAIDLSNEIDDAVSRVLQENPMEIRITQSWMMQVFSGLAEKTSVNIPDNRLFVYELKDRLATLDRLYTFKQDPDIVWAQTMPLLQDGGGESTVELTLCESVLSRVINH